MLLLQIVVSPTIFCFSNDDYRFSPETVTPPPTEVDDMPRKCPQILDGQKADTAGMTGGEIGVVGGAQAPSPLALPRPYTQCAFHLDDDVLPPM